MCCSMEELVNHCFGFSPEESWGQSLKLDPGAGVLGHIISDGFSSYMILGETKARPAQALWLVSHPGFWTFC